MATVTPNGGGRAAIGTRLGAPHVRGHRTTSIHDAAGLYGHRAAFNDVVSGSNGR